MATSMPRLVHCYSILLTLIRVKLCECGFFLCELPDASPFSRFTDEKICLQSNRPKVEPNLKDIKDKLLNFQLNENALGALCLRLAFHDCVDDCDGSVDLQFPANRGLEDIKAWLDVEYEEYGDGLSKADFLQLCGIVAIEHGIDYYNGNSTECMLFGTNCIPKPEFRFKYGRRDKCHHPQRKVSKDFPEASFDTEQLLEYFKVTFSLTASETVALMGAHTLGGLNSMNSGYNGAFTSLPFQFSLEYYEGLLNRKWLLTDVLKTVPSHRIRDDYKGQSKWQFYHELDYKPKDTYTPNSLYADLALVKNMTGIRYGEEVDISTLPENKLTAHIVRQFCLDTSKWMESFATAYAKMGLKGSENIELFSPP